MKKTILKNSVAIALALMAFSSCSLFDKADDISFSTTLKETLSVNETAEATNKVYGSVITLDATADPDVNKYKSKIKSFVVNKISYTISNFIGNPATLTNATISFSSTAGSAGDVVSNLSSLNLQDASTNGTVYELTVDAAGITKIEGYLKNDKAVKIYLSGTLSKTPVAFDVNVTVDVKVEATAI